MIVTLVTPCCDVEFDVEVSWSGGDRVPYGSTYAITPAGWAIEDLPSACLGCGHKFTDLELAELEQDVYAMTESFGPDDEEPEYDPTEIEP